jgi:amicyanin
MHKKFYITSFLIIKNMNRTLMPVIAVVIIAAVILGVVFYIQSGKDSGTEQKQIAESSDAVVEESVEIPEPPEEIVPSEEPIQQPKTYNAEIKDFAFISPALTINVGDTVIWTNRDSVKHTVTSDSESELDSELLPQGGTYAHTFNSAGEFFYHCRPHPYMKGQVVVIG